MLFRGLAHGLMVAWLLSSGQKKARVPLGSAHLQLPGAGKKHRWVPACALVFWGANSSALEVSRKLDFEGLCDARTLTKGNGNQLELDSCVDWPEIRDRLKVGLGDCCQPAEKYFNLLIIDCMREHH